MVDPPGYALLLAGILGTLCGVLKAIRTRNWVVFFIGLVGQLGCEAFLVIVVLTNLRGLIPPSTLLYLLAIGSGGLSVVTDTLLSWLFVGRALTNDTSLAVRSAVLFALPGFGLAGAGYFRIDWKVSVIGVRNLRDPSDPVWPLYDIMCLAGLATVLASGGLGALLALSSALYRGEDEKSDRCARIWFALFFVVMPLGSIILGVAAVLSPRGLIGGFLLIHLIVIGPLVSNALAMLRDIFKSTEAYY